MVIIICNASRRLYTFVPVKTIIHYVVISPWNDDCFHKQQYKQSIWQPCPEALILVCIHTISLDNFIENMVYVFDIFLHGTCVPTCMVYVFDGTIKSMFYNFLFHELDVSVTTENSYDYFRWDFAQRTKKNSIWHEDLLTSHLMSFWSLLQRLPSFPNSTSYKTVSVYFYFLSFNFPGSPYRIIILYIPRLSCHLYLFSIIWWFIVSVYKAIHRFS